MRIRPEKPEEFGAIYEMIQTAFATAKVADGDEQDYVDWLRSDKGYIPKLAMVAEFEENSEGCGQVIGHIILTETEVRDGVETWPVLLLALLCVRLEYRGLGVGAALVREAMKQVKGSGWRAVVLIGDPAYYSRFGFVPAAEFNLRCDDGTPQQLVLAHELYPGALKGKKGLFRQFDPETVPAAMALSVAGATAASEPSSLVIAAKKPLSLADIDNCSAVAAGESSNFAAAVR